MSKISHGQIIGGLSVTPDLQKSIADYRDTLGLDLISQGTVAKELAESWGCSASAGLAMATLQPKSGFPCALRLVEQPNHPDFKPTTTFGWAAYELSSQDVFGWPERLEASGFEIMGMPKELDGMPYFVPMQVTGRGKEMLYLNEVRENMPNCDLPKAQSPVDRIFICILATPDRAVTVRWYEDKLGLKGTDTFTLSYSMINNAFGLGADHKTDLTMVQQGRMTIFEVDDYPTIATNRARHDGMLPPGNAVVSLAVDNLDALKLDWITPPTKYEGFPYEGRRAATVVGSAGELLELIEYA